MTRSSWRDDSVSPPRVVRHLGPQLLGVARGVHTRRGRRGEEVGGVEGVAGVRVGVSTELRPPLTQPRGGGGPPGGGVRGVGSVTNS